MGIGAEKMRPAAFLDRDGTIIVFSNRVLRSSQIRFYRGAPQAIRKLNQLGYLCIVVTNQPNIEKGIITKKKADQLNKLMVSRLKFRGARIDAVYMCPHKYPSSCSCRKPEIGMLLQAKKKFRIDFKKSFVVGDDMRDIALGRRAKIKTILVKTGIGGKDKRFFDAKPDYIAKDLTQSAKIIKKLDD